MNQLPLLPSLLVNLVVLLCSTRSTLCVNKSSSFAALPISLPASERWYVALTASDSL